MQYRTRPTVLLLASMLALAAGCIGAKDRSELLKGIPTTRIRLAPQHTDAPDMLITLPKGFQADWVKEARYDKFYIYDISDTGATQRALLIIDVTPSPYLSIPDTTTVEKSRGSIDGQKVIWREAIYKDDTVQVYQREMVQPDLLKIYQSADRLGPLQLHAIVAGHDRDLVEKLAGSVETIHLLPSRPNL
jgi:hypothetical protein